MKTISYFMIILVACIILGFVSYTASYSYAFETSMNMVEDVSSFFAKPFKAVLQILGISKSTSSQFNAYFAIRSTLDNKVIPKSNPYYDSLQFAVEFQKENFICSKFNREILKDPHDYTVGIVLYFGTDGSFLFGQCSDGRLSPFVSGSSMTVSDWQSMFKGSYFDVKKDTVYIEAPGLDFDNQFKFEADGFQIGIWK